MRQILFLVLTAFGVTLALDIFNFKQGARSKFGIGLSLGSKFYYSIPLYVSEAVDQGWTQHDRPSGAPLPSLVLYCAPELSMCGLYDDTGFLAGNQVAVNKSTFRNASLDWNVQGYSTWTANGEDYWAIQQYFVNEEFLKKSPEDRLASRDNSTTLQMDSMWVTSFNGGLLEIPKSEDKVDSIWSKQNCFPGMGQHYYYNLSKTECTSDNVHPFFILYYQEELVATLWSAYGLYDVVDGERDWFERPSRTQISANFPDTPECQKKLTEQTVATHFWFIGNPWVTVCLPLTKG